MGNFNCKGCDCTSMLRQHEFSIGNKDISQELTTEYKLTSTLTSQGKASKTLQISFDDAVEKIKPLAPKIVAVWQGYVSRKYVKHLKKQTKPNYSYFSKEEILETLSKTRNASAIREKRRLFRHKSGAAYIGEWCGGFKDGYGRMEWPDGAKYEGNFSYSKPHGYGKFVHIDGEVYEGEWKRSYLSPKDIFRTGSNLAKWKDLASDGYLWLWLKQEIFKTEAPKESRLSVSSNKNVKKIPIRFRSNTAQADFTEELLTIKEKFNKIEEEIKKYKRMIKELSKPSMQLIKGQRTYYEEHYKDGSVYIGEWRDEKRDGRGKLVLSNGDTHDGEFKLDKRHGIGLSTWASGDIYIGNYHEDDIHGIGEYKWAGGNTYLGEWKNFQFHGIGRMKYRDGKEYLGMYINGIKAGLGIMTYKDGSRYEGKFNQDKPHGSGLLYEANGKITKGVWDNGNIVEPFQFDTFSN
ncbi:unnamed protein product [Blepharisma stoltei]|uniref:MORN repeat protein n=1 Tax=Blepharisma stoltei TaxID=1481888 RepID=A0AAU9JJZ2_9CILI|nr:unnamed protein product [Blepharisma stoltei]